MPHKSIPLSGGYTAQSIVQSHKRFTRFSDEACGRAPHNHAFCSAPTAFVRFLTSCSSSTLHSQDAPVLEPCGFAGLQGVTRTLGKHQAIWMLPHGASQLKYSIN